MMGEAKYSYRTIVPEQWDRRRRYQFLISAIVPRPIGWISTVSATGLPNLAPFSWFNAVCADPVMVMIAIGRRQGRHKDTSANIRDTRQFVVNVVTEAVADRMVKTSAEYPPETDEFETAGLTPIPSVQVAPARVAESPVHLECVLDRMIELGEGATDLVLGRAVLIHAAVEVCDGDACDIHKLRSVGRLGGRQYCIVDHIVEHDRPSA